MTAKKLGDLSDLPLFRYMDPETSQKGAAHIRPKAGSQMFRLLEQYRQYPLLGLTDEEATTRAGIERGGWKRCSDLRRLGFVTPTGETRIASSGIEQRVCRITEEGLEVLK